MPAKKINTSDFLLTHPKKILYPENKLTKQDLATYYYNIQKWILPYITYRPLTLVRCPDNYKECFYQKHINKNAATEGLFTIKTGTTAVDEYIYIKSAQGLMALPQMGVLEIHTWGSSVEKFNYPDMIIFDLDPAKNVPWEKVVKTAKLIKTYLAKLQLKCFVKTTGGKGLHVVIPIKPEYSWDEVKHFCHSFVELLVNKYPHDYVGKMSKIERKNKIFLDYLRNQKGATAIAPYSTRAKKGAPVSTPLRWSELGNHIEDNTYTMTTIFTRLKKLKSDPWKDFFKIKQSLKLNKWK